MALSWNIDSHDSIEYDAFVDYFTAFGHALFERDLEESAHVMRRLANNRGFLTERLNRSLKDLKSFQSENPYTSQVFVLHASETFYIRANVWEPARSQPGESLFFYESAHDHNFSFLTVGYYGPGYSTRIHEYDGASVIGYPHEPVELRFLEETSLPFGKVMFFRKSVDVHTQMPPADFSISVNVLKRLGPDPADQYFFDLPRGELVSKADKMKNAVVLRLAAAVGDDETLDILAHISRAHACRRTRLLAYEVAAQKRGNEVWVEALADRDALVRTVAERNLADDQNTSQ